MFAGAADSQAPQAEAVATKALADANEPAHVVPLDQAQSGDPVDNDPNGTVRVVGILTEIGKKFGWLAPNLPVPPFSDFHRWMQAHQTAVHCALEWKDDRGKWWYAELRSTKWDHGSKDHRVGIGQFPTTAYIAYGIFICPGRCPRCIDLLGRPITVTLDEVIPKCDYKRVDAEVRKYGAYGKHSGDFGTGGYGKENVGLGGPAYKPGQNSNTMVNYVLKKCGIDHSAPDMTTGWDTQPTFPYSSDTRYPRYNE